MLSIGQIGVHARSPPSCEPRCSFLILVLPLVVSASARRLRSAAAKSAVTSTLQCGQANGAWSLIECWDQRARVHVISHALIDEVAFAGGLAAFLINPVSLAESAPRTDTSTVDR